MTIGMTRTPARRGVAAVHRHHAVPEDELRDLLGIDLDVGLGVDHHRLDLLARDAAFGVELVDREQ